MGINKSIARNIERNRAHTEVMRRLIPPSAEQKAITEKWILPYQEMILAEVRDLRKKADRTLQKEPALRKSLRAWDTRYPKGLCRRIRNEVLDLMKHEMLNADRPGMQAIKNFVRAGGVLVPFWGVDKEIYFQNAIQIGDSILDVANDTVDRAKEPVVFYPKLRDAPITAIDSIEQFADIAEKYWDCDIYPNIYLPWFAPIFPILSIRPADKNLERKEVLELETEVSDLFDKNLQARKDDHLFGLSSDFLFRSRYSEKRLPPAMLDSLLKGDTGLEDARRRLPHIFRTSTDPDDALAAIRFFHVSDDDAKRDKGYFLGDYAKHMGEILAYAEKLWGKPLASVQR